MRVVVEEREIKIIYLAVLLGMAGGRTSLYERQWNEVDALKSIYIVCACKRASYLIV